LLLLYPQQNKYLKKNSELHEFLQVKPTTTEVTSQKAGHRYNFAPEIAEILKKWLRAHVDNPYPSPADMDELMAQTNLRNGQIKDWFINARRRILPQIKKQQQISATEEEEERPENSTRVEKKYIPPE